MRSIERLNEFCECLDTGQPIPPHLTDWLKSSLNHWQNGKPLPVAMNIHDNATERQIRRNALLHEYRLLHPNTSTWQIAQSIAEQIHQNRLSPLLRQADSIYPLPSTARQLYSLLKLNSV